MVITHEASKEERSLREDSLADTDTNDFGNHHEGHLTTSRASRHLYRIFFSVLYCISSQNQNATTPFLTWSFVSSERVSRRATPKELILI
jgi:hypothetical protein